MPAGCADPRRDDAGQKATAPVKVADMPPLRALAAPGMRLEPVTAAHAPEMFVVLRDPAIYEFENEPPASMEGLADRYARLESRRSGDRTQAWLNWVIRLSTGQACGYVQATVLESGAALVAYELASRYWRRGIATAAVTAMLDELRDRYGMTMAFAVLKARNHRSAGLLRKLGFASADAGEAARLGAEADEAVMVRVGTPA